MREWIRNKGVGVGAGSLLFLLGLAHAVFPKRVSLDWQTVTLVVFGMVVCFVPLAQLAAMIETLEFGKFKLSTKAEAVQLNKAVSQASVEYAGLKKVRKAKQPRVAKPATVANLAASASESVFPKFWRVAGRVGQQAKTDKVAALKLLYSSVSTTVRYLYHIANPTSNREFQFRTAVVSLRDTGLITHSLALALLRFQHFCLRATTQKLRDAPGAEDAVLGAIQDGFSLLQVLLSLADDRKALLGPRGAGDEAE